MSTMRDWLHGEVLKSELNEAGGQDGSSGNEEAMKEKEDLTGKRVAVVHCKAGKGRSGSMACSYLLSEEGWTREAALQRFTERRMRPGFGAGVSIPSQLRWLEYVESWTKAGKIYVEQAVEVLELHVWGLRENVKISIEGYEDGGKRIKTFHVFEDGEKDDASDGATSMEDDRTGRGEDVRVLSPDPDGDAKRDRHPSPGKRLKEVVNEAVRKKQDVMNNTSSRTPSRAPSSTRQPSSKRSTPASSIINVDDRSPSRHTPRRSDTMGNYITATTTITQTLSSRTPSSSVLSTSTKNPDTDQTSTSSPKPKPTKPPSRTPSRVSLASDRSPPNRTNTIYRPQQSRPIHIPTNDINLSVQRRTHAHYGLKMVTSIAHVWFNCFFEGRRNLDPSLGQGSEAEGAQTNTDSSDDQETTTSSRSAKSPPQNSGVFEIDWDAMDGLKGSSKKGARAFDRVAVVWRVREEQNPETDPVAREVMEEQKEATIAAKKAAGVSTRNQAAGVVIREPRPGQALRVARGQAARPVAASGAGDEGSSQTRENSREKTNASKGSMDGENGSTSASGSGSEFDEEGTEGIRRGVRGL